MKTESDQAMSIDSTFEFRHGCDMVADEITITPKAFQEHVTQCAAQGSVHCGGPRGGSYARHAYIWDLPLF